jgi:putative hemolysin
MFSDFFLIFLLILLNGFFAAAEIAMVSARESRLQTQAEAGDQRASQALQLQKEPGKFLATVQVGITLVATLASAVGGVGAANSLAPLLAQIPLLEPYADQIALALIVLTISYATLLLGELVPKRLAIRQPERWARSVSGIFEFLGRIFAWPVRFLIASADLVLRLWGEDTPDEESTSPEEVEFLVRRGTDQGTFPRGFTDRKGLRLFTFPSISRRFGPHPGICTCQRLVLGSPGYTAQPADPGDGLHPRRSNPATSFHPAYPRQALYGHHF